MGDTVNKCFVFDYYLSVPQAEPTAFSTRERLLLEERSGYMIYGAKKAADELKLWPENSLLHHIRSLAFFFN